MYMNSVLHRPYHTTRRELVVPSPQAPSLLFPFPKWNDLDMEHVFPVCNGSLVLTRGRSCSVCIFICCGSCEVRSIYTTRNFEKEVMSDGSLALTYAALRCSCSRFADEKVSFQPNESLIMNIQWLGKVHHDI